MTSISDRVTPDGPAFGERDPQRVLMVLLIFAVHEEPVIMCGTRHIAFAFNMKN